ncbi:MAG: methyltransferase domain-containing protein [Planctomycetota bacterium]
MARKRFEHMSAMIPKGARVLDVGADRREWESRLKALDPSISYKSQDINESQTHDFRHLSEIRESFDVILWMEVCEHLSPEEALESIRQFQRILAPGGLVLATTPNIWHPPQYLRDCTHRTPWAYDELGGAFVAGGLKIEGLWRLWNGSALERLWMATFGQWLHRAVGLDFARTLLVAARKT